MKDLMKQFVNSEHLFCFFYFVLLTCDIDFVFKGNLNSKCKSFNYFNRSHMICVMGSQDANMFSFVFAGLILLKEGFQHRNSVMSCMWFIHFPMDPIHMMSSWIGLELVFSVCMSQSLQIHQNTVKNIGWYFFNICL